MHKLSGNRGGEKSESLRERIAGAASAESCGYVDPLPPAAGAGSAEEAVPLCRVLSFCCVYCSVAGRPGLSMRALKLAHKYDTLTLKISYAQDFLTLMARAGPARASHMQKQLPSLQAEE